MPTLLVVSGDIALRKHLRELFDHVGGFDVCEEAVNGVEAFEKIKGLLPNLVVLDFLLPDMSGLQLAEKLKTITPELPIFMLTADYDMNIEKSARSCGITAVFSRLDDLATLAANARAECGIK